MKRIVYRRLPDGRAAYVSPFHISMKGMEKLILFRDDYDYDAMVKILCICAKRKNVIVIIYAVVSNHCHVAVLANSQKEADDYGQEIKRMYSMWFRNKYGQSRTLAGVDIKAIALDNDWYVRNALAYIPRNALDNGCNVNDYNWSGFNAMFKDRKQSGLIPVKGLTKKQKRDIMHTGDKLDDVPWLLDKDGCLVPSSFCDYTYLEQAFNNDLSFFLKAIGAQNSSEMTWKLVDGPRTMLADGEFLKAIDEISIRWFQSRVSDLSIQSKIRLLPYVYRTAKTSVPQLSRTFGLSREEISRILSPVRARSQKNAGTMPGDVPLRAL